MAKEGKMEVLTWTLKENRKLEAEMSDEIWDFLSDNETKLIVQHVDSLTRVLVSFE